MVSAHDYKALQDASVHFLAENDLSHLQVENVMVLVFGEYNVHNRYAEGTKENMWRLYFSGLAVHEECTNGGDMNSLAPLVRDYRLHVQYSTN